MEEFEECATMKRKMLKRGWVFHDGSWPKIERVLSCFELHDKNGGMLIVKPNFTAEARFGFKQEKM